MPSIDNWRRWLWVPAFAGTTGGVWSLLRQTVRLLHPRPHIHEHFRQRRLDLLDGHAGLDPRVIQNVQDVLVVDVEEYHRDIVVEHGPGHRRIVVDVPH